MTEYANALTVTLKPPVVPGVNAAPAAVWFEVEAVTGPDPQRTVQGAVAPEVYDPAYHELYYHWEFGDAAQATPSTVLNIPNRWKDINQGFGRIVAHTYNDPGSYTVRCTVYDPLNRLYGVAVLDGRQAVEIGDPKTVFPDGQTLVYDPQDVGGSPPGARAFTDWDVLKRFWSAAGDRPSRVLLAPGVELVFDGADRISAGAIGMSNIRIGALDPGGVRPRLRKTGVQGRGGNEAIIDDRSAVNREIVLYGLDLEGEWNAATENGRWTRPIVIQQKENSALPEYLFLAHRCNWSGFEAIRHCQEMHPGGIAYGMHSDNSITNWQNYGSNPGPNNVTNIKSAFVGCSVAQDINAISGGPKNGLFNNHGSIRELGGLHTYIDACDLLSRNGWSVGTSRTKDNLVGTADQPALRINAVGARGKQAYVTRCMIEGVVAMNASGGQTELEGNYVFDSNIIVGNAMAFATATGVFRLGGLTMRNAVLIRPDVEDYGVNARWTEWFSTAHIKGDSGSSAAGVRFYNITAVDLRSTARAEGQENQPIHDPGSKEQFTTIIEENNVNHRPALDGAVIIPGETIDLAAVLDGAVLRHRGPRLPLSFVRGFRIGDHSGGRDVASGQTLTVPYAVILDGPMDRDGGRSGAPTDQVYWQAIAEIDVLHRLRVGPVVHHADLGQIEVTFGATGAEIANRSGATWKADDVYVLKLDRSSLLPSFRAAFDTSSGPLIRAEATDPDTKTEPAGQIAYSDVMGAERPETGDRRGALTGP